MRKRVNNQATRPWRKRSSLTLRESMPLVLLVVVWCCSGGSVPGYESDVVASQAIASGQRALESCEPLPWYDSEHDQFQRIHVEPSKDDTGRHSQWVYTPTPKKPFRGFDWRHLFSTILKILAWAILGLLAGLLIWGLVRAIKHKSARGITTEETADTIEAAQARIEDLPMPVSPEHTDLLSAAQSFVDAGDYGKAVIYLFAHQLVELDKRHLIQLTRGKTNREYLVELKRQPQFIELLKPAMLASEDVFFGHHELSRERFQMCWKNLDRFQQQLEQVAL